MTNEDYRRDNLGCIGDYAILSAGYGEAGD